MNSGGPQRTGQALRRPVHPLPPAAEVATLAADAASGLPSLSAGGTHGTRQAPRISTSRNHTCAVRGETA